MPEETSNDRAQRFDRQIESTKAKNVRDRSVAIAWLAEALRELERKDPSQRFDALSALASAIDDPWAQADAVHGLVNGLAALERKDRTQRYDTCVELARSINSEALRISGADSNRNDCCI